MNQKVGIAVVLVLAAGAGGWVGWRIGQGAGPLTAPKVKSAHVKGMLQVPGSALGVGTFEAGWMIDQLLDHNLHLVPSRGDDGAMREELSAVSLEHFGIDLLKLSRVTVWVGGRPPFDMAIAARLHGPFDGELVGPRREIDGIGVVELASDAFAILRHGDLLVGNAYGIREMIAMEKGQREPLSDDTYRLEGHKRALGGVDDGTFVASATVPVPGIDGVAFAMAPDSFSASVVGSESRLKELYGLYETAVKRATSELEQQIRKARAEGNPQELVLILAKHKLKDVLAAVPVDLTGRQLTVEAHGEGGVMAFVLAGLAGNAMFMYRRAALRQERLREEMEKQQRTLERLQRGGPR